MTRQQIFLIVAGLLAVVLIYQLPRVVVENETGVEVKPHDISITAEDERAFSALRQLLKEAEEIKKSVNFADSLAQLHLKYQEIDSAVKYAELIEALDTAGAYGVKAAMIYYQAFQMSQNPDSAAARAAKAQGIFENLLVEDPQNSFLKNKLAMTLMVTQAPMAGVQMLREVLEAEPQNREATLNLGLLAIRSGQYDRAIGRFEELLKMDSLDDEALFYYGVALSESGEVEKAVSVFEKLMNTEGADPALKATASTYIEEL